MRNYYASDKKRREDAKKKQQAEKRMKKLSKSEKTDEPSVQVEENTIPTVSDSSDPQV
jgi:hypothetical protein